MFQLKSLQLAQNIHVSLEIVELGSDYAHFSKLFATGLDKCINLRLCVSHLQQLQLARIMRISCRKIELVLQYACFT